METGRTKFWLGLGENRVKVDIDEESPEYQAFLKANAALEDSREENGYVTPEAHEAYKEAIQAVSEFAARIYSTLHSS